MSRLGLWLCDGVAAGTWRVVAGLSVVVGLGLGVRLQPWPDVFVPEYAGAAFVGDTDTYYHALRADRIAQDYPRTPWRDENMNFPHGAVILWPPLFDHAIASGAWLLSGGSPTRATVERVAAVLPPLLGAVTVGVVWTIGLVLFGRGPWPAAALLFALLPSHTEFSVVGRPDQHVSELLLMALVMLSFAGGWVRERRAGLRRLWALSLGVAITLSFWNWQGSALYLILLCGFAAIWHCVDGEEVIARRVHETLGLGAGAGAALLFMSVLLLGPPGAARSAGLSGINGIQVLLTAMVAVFAVGLRLALATRRAVPSVRRRGLEVLISAVIPFAAAWVLLPGLRSGVAQGLLALTAGNPWYASIREFQPPLFGGNGIRNDLAAWLPRFAPMFAMPPAAWGLRRLWRQHPEHRPAIAFIATWGATVFVLTLLRLRFALYLSIPAVLWVAIGLRELAECVDQRLRRDWTRSAIVAGGIAALLAPALFYFSHGGLRRDPTQIEVIAALEWLRGRSNRDLGRAAVFSEWDWGHLIQYYANRPAVATPFGTDGGEGAMEDMAAFFLTRSSGEATRLLDERRAGYLLIVDPLTHVAESAAWAPRGVRSPVVAEWHPIEGPRMVVTPEVDDLIAVRVYYDNGLSSRDRPTLSNYRLVYEGAAVPIRQVRLFQIVPGAELSVRGVSSGRAVRAVVGIRTNRGRNATWHKSAEPDADGVAVLRVPFSTGDNGAVTAGPYTITCGETDAIVAVPFEAVESGRSVPVDCSAEHGSN